MDDRVVYKKQASYPHMKPADVLIWNRFIDKFPDAYDTVIYDLTLGDGPEFDTTVNDATGGNVKRLYQKKIDVVGFKNGKVDIIEIKPLAGLGAFGQVLSYEILYLEHIDPDAKTRAVILTDRLMPDMAKLAPQHEVDIIVV